MEWDFWEKFKMKEEMIRGKLIMPTANEKKTEILKSTENKTVVAFLGSVKDWY